MLLSLPMEGLTRAARPVWASIVTLGVVSVLTAGTLVVVVALTGML